MTTSRIAVLEVLSSLKDHPRAEKIIEKIREVYPQIAVGTIYKSLETLSEHGLISKVKTEKDVMRYDGHIEEHHHLYESGGDRIVDYEDAELDRILKEHFKNKQIPGFEVDDIRLQIKGKFKK